MNTFGEKVIAFHNNLSFSKKLPAGVRILNPFQGNPEVQAILEEFYTRFFSDNHQRKMLIGINPGRFGAGLTGIPFTDTKHLKTACGIHRASFESHEPSAAFIYEMINAYGGVHKFYRDFYIDSVCPLGFVRHNKKGNWVNCNYYDDRELYETVKPFMVASLKKQIAFGIDTRRAYSLGKKNADFLTKINQEEQLFEQVTALPHPRYVMQYRYKEKEDFINFYLKKLSEKP